MTNEDWIMQNLRWVERFENFEKAKKNLSIAKDYIAQNGITDIAIMALVQAFEITFELAWKTQKDYLEYNGIKVNTPRETIKEAFQSNIIEDGQIWIDMMESRNKTSHTYNVEFANQLAHEILEKYIPQFENLYTFFKGKING